MRPTGLERGDDEGAQRLRIVRQQLRQGEPPGSGAGRPGRSMSAWVGSTRAGRTPGGAGHIVHSGGPMLPAAPPVEPQSRRYHLLEKIRIEVVPRGRIIYCWTVRASRGGDSYDRTSFYDGRRIMFDGAAAPSRGYRRDILAGTRRGPHVQRDPGCRFRKPTVIFRWATLRRREPTSTPSSRVVTGPRCRHAGLGTIARVG